MTKKEFRNLIISARDRLKNDSNIVLILDILLVGFDSIKE